MSSIGPSALVFVLAFGAGAPSGVVEPVRLTYDAPASCPDEEFFFDQMRARTSRVRLAEKEEPAREIVVSVAVDEAGARGRLDVRTVSGESSVREVAGRKCEQIVAALAFVAALGVDPRASMTPSELPPEEPPSEPVVGAPSSTVPASPPDRSVRAPVPPAPPKAWSAIAGGDLSSLVGLLPTPAWGGRVWLDVRARSPATLFAPSGRVSLGGAATVSHAIGPGMARFQLATVRLDGCPLRWPARSPWQLEPCAFVEAGALFGQGIQIPAPKSSVTQHLTMGPLARLSFLPSTSVRIGLEAALVFPLVRANISFSDRVAHEVPAWGASFGIGAGMNFL